MCPLQLRTEAKRREVVRAAEVQGESAARVSGVITTAARHLMAAGLTGEALLEALGDIEQAMNAPAVDKARSSGALRTQRYRERKAAEASQVTSQSVTSDECDAECDVVTAEQEKAPTLPLPPNENNSNPPTPTHPNNIPPREAVPFDAHVGAWLEWLAAKPKGKGGKRVSSSDTPDRPEEVSEQVWSDFLKHRRKHKADLTTTALAGFRREADRVGWSLERAIEESILRNWRGFKADWVKNDDRNGNSNWGAPAGHRQPRTRTDGFTDAINDALARSGSGPATGPSGQAFDDYGSGDTGLRPARARVIR